jgi:hypothetical protein
MLLALLRPAMGPVFLPVFGTLCRPVVALALRLLRLPGGGGPLRRGGCRGRVGKRMSGIYRYLPAYQLLNVAQVFPFFCFAKRKGLSACPSPAGAAYAVHVGFGYVG